METIIHGDCLEKLKEIPDNSIDSIVTDPPYGLSFMGKKWDYDVPSEEVWRECLRVLKPGGHLLSFAGTRTQHRMAVRIEDAGFEIRDMIAWIYGSGFPKSLNIGKAVDKQDAVDARLARRYRFTMWMVAACSLSACDMDVVCGTNTMGRHWTDVLPNGKQPDIPTRTNFEKLRPYITAEIPQWVEQMVDERTVESENFKRREVVGKKDGNLLAVAPGQENDRSATTLDITAPATEAAKQWQGWGTALKPALEPITVARKPLIGTVAENILTHGTGGLNIDGSRIATEELTPRNNNNTATIYEKGFEGEPKIINPSPLGRWPANLLHDGSEEVLECFPNTKPSKAAARGGTNPNPMDWGNG